MDCIDWQAFLGQSKAVDEAARVSPGIMRFCSTFAWQVSAHEAFYPHRAPLVFQKGNHWILLCGGELPPFQKILQPFESDWFFGCPVLGPDPRVGCQILLDILLELRSDYPLVWLGGIPRDGLLDRLLLSRFSRFFRIQRLDGCDCHFASLEGGKAGYFSRRSGRFRRFIRKIRENAESAGVEVEQVREGSAETIMGRLLDIERRSWKSKAGESIFEQPRFVDFYHRLIRRLLPENRFRMVILQRGGRDFAYAMGGVFDKEFRGFQLGYHADAASLNPGHLCQDFLIQLLCDEGILSYDLGMIMDYKERWAESVHSIANIVLVARG